MSEMSKLPNVGKVLDKLLIDVSISTPEQLRQIGAKEAFVRIRMRDSTACIRMLYGLQGAIEGVHDKFLTDSTKQELKEFFRSL